MYTPSCLNDSAICRRCRATKGTSPMPLDSVPIAAPTVPAQMTEDSIAVACSPAHLWSGLVTVPPLPRWSPLVCGELPPRGGSARPGAGRSWQIVLGRRRGRVTARCIEARDACRLSYLVECDGGPLARILTGLAFSFDLVAAEQGKTLLRLRTYYPTRGAMARVQRMPAVRRQFAALRMAMLSHLKRAAERAAAESVMGHGPWERGAVVPPVMLLMRER